MENPSGSDDNNAPEKPRKNLPGFARSAAVLEVIAARPSRIVEVTKELGLPWATVHRTIKSLEKERFIDRNPETGRYEIGARMWHIGSSYLANNRALSAAITYLAQERNIKHVDIQLVERIENYSVVTHAEKRQTQPISKAQYGFHIPLHAGSKGWVLLAHEDPEFIDAYLRRPLERLTPATTTDPSILRSKLDGVRDLGYAFTVGDVQPFTGSLAAPIIGSTGDVVACICFVFLAHVATNEDMIADLKEKLLLMTHTVSMELGWRPGQNQPSA
jgi:DNA-binding IclR family transcriptional regulator